MRLTCLFALLAVAGVGGTTFAADKSPLKIANFTLQDFRGKEHSLSRRGDARLVVVAFLGTECPLAKHYGARLARLAKEYEAKGVAFLGIDSNAQDSVTAMAAYARLHDIAFPLLKDVGNKIADRFGAMRTPTVYLLDKDRVVRYQGRIDDQYGIGYQRDKPRSQDLVNAINDLLAGKAVSRAATKAEGCIIGRVRPAQAASPVTYSKHIAPIFNRRCVECHRQGEIAPFELTSHAQASGWAAMIAEVVEEGRMPPWHADPRHGKFVNDRRLSAAEKKLILEWAAAGAPEGDPRDLPSPPTFPQTGWQLPRKPDVVVPIRSTPVNVPATGAVRYQYFFADPGFKEDKWIEAVEVQPGNRAVVHHILVFALPEKGGRAAAAALGGGVQGFLAGYVPGLRPIPYPPGMAKRVAAGSKLIFQVHYTPNGSPQTDLSKVAFLFTDPARITHEVKTISAANRRGLSIPPGAANHKVEATRRIADDALLLGFMPHMHVRGKSFFYEAITADGKKETLLDVPNFDFNWQTAYRLATPRKLAAGDRVHCIAAYDNSAGNLSNPDPTKTVRWGDQTWNEMMIGYFDIAVARGKEKEQP
ncbi:MAG: redoxin domain-containing protein [Planctomycetes bacterium]|nr:redoxin domain-containing protein [Planctomycetota bacterium]